jgi:hypothetical protein
VRPSAVSRGPLLLGVRQQGQDKSEKLLKQAQKKTAPDMAISSKDILMAPVPHWLTSLVDVVGSCMEAHSPQGPLAFRWGEEEGFWEVMVYPTPGEVVGGADDGALLVPGFSLDVQELTAVFEEVVAVHWRSQSFGPHDDVGPHIAVEGVFQGHQVYLQVLAEASANEEPGFKVDLLKPKTGP